MATTFTPPAKQPAKPQETTLTAMNVGEFLFSDHVKREIQNAAPSLMKPERLIRMALTTIRRTPALLKCSKQSLIAAMVQASELGLELSGPLGQAYMIPRKGEACFQIGYRGFIRLAANTGQVAYLNARAVFDGDVFDYGLGDPQFLKHSRGRTKPDPAKITHFYAVLKPRNVAEGVASIEVWPVEWMREHRDKFRSDKSRTREKDYRGPWDDHFVAMGCKTMIREICKSAPMCGDLMAIASRDEYAEFGHDTPNSPGELLEPRVNVGESEAVKPETQDDIDAELHRIGGVGNAAEDLQSKYAPNGELTEAAAQQLLAELRSMPDAGD